ncbi:unnamed protein product [Prorocentrum cordatum]|uniref:Uncharacterized protein n=1 Tax=Prorocentrum cordatum TaxID=2364126 RepID=A0ABN9S2B9_9DINO|nr:unnamed protein product [Polarella glacialis]
MAPHLSKRELDRCFSLYAAGKTPVETRDLVSRTRESLDETGPDLTTVRRALRGATHRRGPAETRGRKPKLTAVKLRALNNARVRLIRAAKGEAEVHLRDVMKAARVSDVHKGTASRHFKRLGVTWRAPRAEPLRGSAEAEERVAVCSGWKRLPGNYFTHQVDAIIDNKVFPIPMTKRAKTHAKKSRVRGHLRTKAEGVLKPFTKPKGNRNRVNPGAKVHVAAAIVNNKVRVWHYLPTLWCADAACDFYAGVLAPALRRCRKGRRAFRILEDNDPTGYKSKKAVDCKRGLKITPLKFPKYSPDLNPLDYFLWAEVNRRMAEQSAPANESQSAYKARLRRVAMGIPKSVIRAAVAKMKTKAAEVVVAEGGRRRQGALPGACNVELAAGAEAFAGPDRTAPGPASMSTADAPGPFEFCGALRLLRRRLRQKTDTGRVVPSPPVPSAGVDAEAVETKVIRDALKAVLVGKDLKHISLRERRRQVALKLGLQEHALDQRKHEFKSLTTEVVSETQPDQDAASPLETVLAEAEKPDSLQWVYLVTISRVLDATLPDGRQCRDLGTMSREDIGKAVADAFNNPIPTGSAGGRPRKEPDGQALVSMAVVFQEKHKDGAIHFHVAVKLTRSGCFQQAKRTLRERHLLPSHFSGSHRRMWSAVRYGHMETPAKPDVDDAPWVWQPDWAGFARENDAIDLFEMSQEPYMAGAWVKRREATDKAAGAMGTKTTFELVDLTSTIIAKHLWAKDSLMAYVQDRGTKAMQGFVRSRLRKLTADLEETKEWASARENAAFEAVDDWTLVCRCAEETCPHGPACSYRSAVETIFSRNAASFDVRELAASLRDILMVGPKKTTRVPFLVGPSNSGKSTVVYPFDDLFTPKRVLHKPALGPSFGLRNLASGTKRFIFWDDFRPVEFAHEKTVPVSLFLSLFVGQHTEIQISQSFNDGNKDVCWNHGAVFTGKLEGLWETTNKVGAEDIRHMQNRVRQFPFTSVLSDGSLQDVLSCAPCMTAWIVREAAKFDAVGVFRPAPAALAAADAGVPPVSGFDDLMSDARIPRAQADALLADVRAMGAVAVDEAGQEDEMSTFVRKQYSASQLDFKQAMGMPAVDGGLSAQEAHMSKYLFPEAIQELLVTPLEHLPAFGPRLSLPTFDDFEKAGEDLDYIKKRRMRSETRLPFAHNYEQDTYGLLNGDVSADWYKLGTLYGDVRAHHPLFWPLNGGSARGARQTESDVEDTGAGDKSEKIEKIEKDSKARRKGDKDGDQVLSGFEVVLTAVLVLMAIEPYGPWHLSLGVPCTAMLTDPSMPRRRLRQKTDTGYVVPSPPVPSAGVDAEAVETKAIRDALKAVLVGKDLKHISLRECRRQVALKLGLQEHALDQRKHEFKSLTTEVVSETQPDQDAASPLETVLAEAEKLDSLQWVYLVTISRVLDATLPDGRQHTRGGVVIDVDVIGCVGEPDGQALVSMAVVFQEKHKDGAIHFHVAVKLTRSGCFQQAKRTLRERHLLPSHFSGSHRRMWSAVRYGHMETPAKPDVDDAPWVWQPDWAGFARENDAIDLFEMSQEPYMAGAWVKRREATDKAAGAMGTKTTFELVDLTSTIIAKHLWAKDSLMAYVQDRGTKAMQGFVRSRLRKLTADLEETKEWASARENAAFEAVDDWTLVCRCAEETCPHGPACSYRSAVETIFSRNAASFDVRELAASLRDILMVGPKKTTRVPFLVGPSNSGKSTVVYPFDDLFTPKRVLHKPALGPSFGLRNLASGTKRFIFWDDFRPVEFAHEKTVPVSLFLSLFVGQHTEIQISQSFNDGNKDVCWNHGAVFTGKLEGLWETTNKVGAEDIRHMQNRVRQFPFTSVLSDGSLQDVLSCAPCMTAWIVREAAKFDAVGVFRPAPAAPAAADAGVPPVSGFDDLMSDARIPRAQADALLADVRAMGAVAVDEVLPADWVCLNSWALLLPLQKRRLLGQIGSPVSP